MVVGRVVAMYVHDWCTSLYDSVKCNTEPHGNFSLLLLLFSEQRIRAPGIDITVYSSYGSNGGTRVVGRVVVI